MGAVGEKMIKAMLAKYPTVKGPADITPAVRVANACDAVHQGYYKIDRYEGLIKTYVKPFTPTQHDALAAGDSVWAQFIDDRTEPVGLTS